MKLSDHPQRRNFNDPGHAHFSRFYSAGMDDRLRRMIERVQPRRYQ